MSNTLYNIPFHLAKNPICRKYVLKSQNETIKHMPKSMVSVGEALGKITLLIINCI